MLSCNCLGNYGRLGNQMFQYASLRGIASNRGFEFCIPPENVFGINDWKVQSSGINIHNTFNISWVKTHQTNNKKFEERFYHFDKDLFDNCEDNVDLFGYFQTEKYFKDIENEIRKDFSFSKKITDNCLEFIKSIDLNQEIISLHIRRGDYVDLQEYHPIPSFDYYSKALDCLPDVPVLIFSDDPEWCMQQEIFNEDRFFVSTSNDASTDMCLMTLCNYHIIANSSFSWWGAWLAQSEKVICPKTWFGESLKQHNTSDLYCEGWIKL